MDEARFIFEFINRASNGGGPASGSTPPGGSSSTRPASTDPGDAHDNNERQRPTPRDRQPAPVPPVTPRTTGIGEDAAAKVDYAGLGSSARDFAGAFGAAATARGPMELVDRLGNVKRTAEQLAQRASDALPGIARDLIGRPGVAVPMVEPRSTGAPSTPKATPSADKPPAWVPPTVNVPALKPYTPAAQLPQVIPAAASITARATAATASLQASGLVAPAAATAGSAALRASVAAAAAGGTGAGATGAAGAAGLAGAAGPIGLAAAAGAATVAIASAPFLAAGRQMAADKDYLAQFSPEVARAQAMAEVRDITSRMRSSERIGGIVGDYTTATSQLNAEMRKMKDSLVEAFGPEFIMAIQALTLALNTANKVTGNKAVQEAAKSTGLNAVFGPYAGIVEALLPQMKEYYNKASKAIDKNEETFLTWFDRQPWPAPNWWPEHDSGEVRGAQLEQIPGLMM